MKKTLLLLLALFATLALAQTDMIPDHLKECPAKDNCVSSQSKVLKHKIEPIRFEADADWEQIKKVVTDLGGEIITDKKPYLHAVFTSFIFRFKDDLELVLIEKTLHLRSASRTGYSDMGVNKKRTEKLRLALTP